MPNQIEIDAYYHLLAYEDESDYEYENFDDEYEWEWIFRKLNLTKKWMIKQIIEWRREKNVKNLSKNENRKSTKKRDSQE